MASSDDTLAPFNSATLAALKLKHPPRVASYSQNSDQLQTTQTMPSLVLDESEIVAAIKTFPNGSSGGVDGLRPQHLKDMTSQCCGLVEFFFRPS